MTAASLPVAAALPEIRRLLQGQRQLLLEAAPGAGKTMLVPPLAAELTGQRVLVTEPRRVAAAAAAAGMAAIQGWTAGRECGYAVRGESLCSAETKVLFVTPGVLLRQLRENPELPGVGAVIFDEFHERTWEMDLALAQLREVRQVLREDLLTVVMSATLNTGELAAALDLPVLKVPGREFPLTVEYTPPRSNAPEDLRREILRSIGRAAAGGEGHILVFLPGVEEIRRLTELLAAERPPGTEILPLHGSLTLAEQQRAVRPAAPGVRKIILSTNVAESSVTVDGVTAVVDSGLEKRAVYHPEAGLTFLEQVHITMASAKQRAGRAGRTAPGAVYRCWERSRESAFSADTEPEIRTADLSAPVLLAADWGTPARELPWPEPPAEAAVAAGEEVLRRLGLMTESGELTAAGRRAAALPVPPRLGAMLLAAEARGVLPLAAEIAGILEEREARGMFPGADLRLRIDYYRQHPGRGARQRELCRKLLAMFHCRYEEQPADQAGVLLAAGYPEFVAGSRESRGRSYQLAGSRAGRLPEGDYLTGEKFLAAARLNCADRPEGDIELAAPLTAAELEELFAGQITERVTEVWNSDRTRVTALRERRFGELVLSSAPCPLTPEVRTAALLKEAARRGIALIPERDSAAKSLLARIELAAGEIAGLPDLQGEGLLKLLLELAAGGMITLNSLAELEKLHLHEILAGVLPPGAKRELDALYPVYFRLPGGREVRIEYESEVPEIAVPVQQLYGLESHPAVGRKKLPLRLVLLSPARRPVQVTSDLPGFWRGSWELVRKEMKGRYPKHNWDYQPESK